MLADLKAEASRRKVTVNALVLRAIRKEIDQWSDDEVASMRAKLKRPLTINRIPPRPSAWPSGAALLPEHTADPGPGARERFVRRDTYPDWMRKGPKKP
jgi:hypothetical protein